jgi:hypothetical protein
MVISLGTWRIPKARAGMTFDPVPEGMPGCRHALSRAAREGIPNKKTGDEASFITGRGSPRACGGEGGELRRAGCHEHNVGTG